MFINERLHTGYFYIQVAYLLTDAATVEREFGNLLLIQDNYKKMVVSLDAPGKNTLNGIEHWNLQQFLEDFGSDSWLNSNSAG